MEHKIDSCNPPAIISIPGPAVDIAIGYDRVDFTLNGRRFAAAVIDITDHELKIGPKKKKRRR